MIDRQGLVKFNGDESDLQRKVAAAYRDFRKRFFPVAGLSKLFVGAIRWLRDQVIAVRNSIFDYDPYDRTQAIFGKSGESDADNPVGPPIAFVGLWDTVGAYGLPTDELTTAWDRYFWPLRAPDRDIARNIAKAWHALALNDERYTFKPVLWNEKNEPQDRTSIFEETITQVWFAGMHADVGGGYPDDAMAYIPLRWIIKGAKHHGLKVLSGTGKTD